MGLRDSRIINSVHPWLGARLTWLAQVATILGSTQSLFSGVRSLDEQQRLYDRQSLRPAAFPGCSQHQYGFAADAGYTPITLISTKGRPSVSTAKETTSFFNSAARHVGLTLVANDDGHYQIYPGIQFREWAVSRGLCNPNPPPPFSGGLTGSFLHPDGVVVTNPDGSREWVWNTTR
jgi:hypothetical protein